MKSKLPFRCRWGFHKWFYVAQFYHPFYSTFNGYWRGCTLCHKDQYPIHPVVGIGRGDGAALLHFEWTDVPNMRERSNWKQFQHPSGWTTGWYKIPFEGLMSYKDKPWSEVLDIIATIDDHIC